MKLLFVKLMWAWKLLRSKAFVVLTDKTSVICIDGLKDPESFTSLLTLTGQKQGLEQFQTALTDLAKRHEKAMQVFLKGKGTIDGKTTQTKKTPTKAPRSKRV